MELSCDALPEAHCVLVVAIFGREPSLASGSYLSDETYSSSDESRRFAGEIETLSGHLKPIASDSRISTLLRKGFIGRKWLFDAIEQWRNPQSSIPDPQSTISPEFIPHNSSFNLSSSPSRLFWITGDPGVGKSAFAAHLTHFGRDKVIAAQFVEWDKPDHRDARRVVRSLAFQLATRLPDYRKLLLTLPEIAELDRKDPAELFDYLLANPLKTVIGGGRERLLIVIDALDEAGGAGRNPLVEMLARHAPRLPDWLGLVVTSRPESAVQTPLQGLNPFVLDTRTEANRADLRDFLRHQLAPQLQQHPDADRLVGEILEKSEGVFLYAERFCDDVQLGHLSLDRPEQFPQGLGGIFCQWFQRQFPDLEKFRKDIRPALRAILAAREPLPVEILQRLFHWQDEELRDFTRTLGSLFPVTKEANGEVIKPYHKSLADWLADEAKAGVYFVSEREGHRVLADSGCSFWQESANTTPTYFLIHLPSHLIKVGRLTDLTQILFDCKWLRVKTQKALVQELIQDYDTRRGGVTGNPIQESDLILLASALRLSASALSHFPNQLAGQLHGRLLSSHSSKIRTLLEDLVQQINAPCLLPRNQGLNPPCQEIRFSWQVFDHPPGARIALSEDDRIIAVFTKDQESFWDAQLGISIERHIAEQHFVHIDRQEWLHGIPASVGSDNLDYKIHKGHVLAHCLLRSERNNMTGFSVDGGVFVCDHLRNDEQNASQPLTGSVPKGNFYQEEGFLCATFSHDGLSIIAAGHKGIVKCWNVATRELIFTGKLGDDSIIAIQPFNHSKLYAALTISGTMLVGELAIDGGSLETSSNRQAGPIGLWFTQDDSQVVLVDKCPSVTFWDFLSCRKMFKFEEYLGSVAVLETKLTADRRFMFISSLTAEVYDGVYLHVFDLKKMKLVRRFEAAPLIVTRNQKPWEVRCLALDCRRIAEISQSYKDKHTFDLETGEDVVSGISVAAQGEHWLPTAPTSRHCCWRLEGGGNTCIVRVADMGEASFTADSKIDAVALSSDGKHAVLCCVSGEIHFVDFIITQNLANERDFVVETIRNLKEITHAH